MFYFIFSSFLPSFLSFLEPLINHDFFIPVFAFAAGALLLDVVYTIGQPDWQKRETQPVARKYGAPGFIVSGLLLFALAATPMFVTGLPLLALGLIGMQGSFHVAAFAQNYRQNKKNGLRQL